VAVLGADSTFYALSVFKLEEVVLLHMVVVNMSSVAKPIRPNDFTLLDGNRFVFRRLEPHQAANIYLSHLKNLPLYQPKQSPYVETRTTIQEVYPGYYTARSYEYRNPVGEAAYQAGYDFGYTLGAAITQSKNKKYSQMAGTLYSLGLVDGSFVPAKANSEGALYWLNREGHVNPIRLRLVDGSEIEFEIKTDLKTATEP
jgi:hypothetical protein